MVEEEREVLRTVPWNEDLCSPDFNPAGLLISMHREGHRSEYFFIDPETTVWRLGVYYDDPGQRAWHWKKLYVVNARWQKRIRQDVAEIL